MLTAAYMRIRAYVFMACMTFVGVFALTVLLFAVPLRLVKLQWYRNITTCMLDCVVPGFLLAPTLAGLRINVDAEQWKTQQALRADALVSIIMCNHASRVDWLLALWCGYVQNTVRVSFLTEGPMQFLPIVGWMRKLCEDIFVWRSFKLDKPRIDANIESFKATKTQRALFLAIEGAIVDQGEFDKHYIEECSKFCESLGYEPFEYVLTPRYKGIHSLAQHAGKEVFSVTTAFVRDGDVLNKKLTDPKRVVPDLYTILASPIDVTCHFDRFEISSEQELAKRQCMDNYKYRDGMIAHFNEKGCFPTGLAYNPLPLELPKRLASLAMQFALYYAGLELFYGKGYYLGYLMVGLVAVLGTCHSLGELLSGESRESIPFETIFKSYLYAGRDQKLLKKSKGKAAESADAQPAAEKLTETAKMFSLMTKFPAN
mmetsp:Transcript_24089/g.65158  ORF Transcript_24089/g.65158 Transcript_24089/m.65158 type:complete len:429 (+) Transcript_24089:118-1404(+)